MKNIPEEIDITNTKEHYRQVAYKLQDDILIMHEDELSFYEKMYSVALKAMNENDLPSKEMALKMISDSIDYHKKEIDRITKGNQ